MASNWTSSDSQLPDEGQIIFVREQNDNAIAVVKYLGITRSKWYGNRHAFLEIGEEIPEYMIPTADEFHWTPVVFPKIQGMKTE